MEHETHKEHEREHGTHKPKHEVHHRHRKDNKVGLDKLLIIGFAINILLMLFVLTQLSGLSNKIESLSISGSEIKTGEDTAPQGAQAPTPSPESEPQADLSAIADDDPSIGPDNAKVTVVEFSDFECSYCGAAAGTHEGLVSQFKSRDPTWEAPVPKLKELAEQGKIRLVYRDFPLRFHQNAQKASEAAECADEQGKFWEYHDKIFENQGSIDVASLKKYASDLGLNTAKFNECLDSGKMADEVTKDLNDGAKLGVSGTPAFFINGKLISGAQSFSAFKSIIDQELAK
ncbi:hypothetical protein CMO89_03235 [Candidatus Woesearchaeota archaeon]|jgi:protein-disulfide isomerase|nr:hypothetical protein [Candidatus Woesearchaeota archaeon]|tara:strand:+ start:6136 stop:6999 length:864 start_codon:yes stop_codon:yes gene_type:complete